MDLTPEQYDRKIVALLREGLRRMEQGRPGGAASYISDAGGLLRARLALTNPTRRGSWERHCFRTGNGPPDDPTRDSDLARRVTP